MDDGSVQQQRGVIGRNVYWHSADEMGNVSVDYLKRCRFVYRQKRPMSRRPGYFETFSYSCAPRYTVSSLWNGTSKDQTSAMRPESHSLPQLDKRLLRVATPEPNPH